MHEFWAKTRLAFRQLILKFSTEAKDDALCGYAEELAMAWHMAF